MREHITGLGFRVRHNGGDRPSGSTRGTQEVYLEIVAGWGTQPG